MNVRAPKPPGAPSGKTRPAADPIFQLAFNEGDACYRVRAWKDEVDPCEGGYREVGRYNSPKELLGALDEIPADPGYVVLENSTTGEVHVEREYNLTDNWTQGGRFDQITLFTDEEAAFRYADARSTD